MSHDVAFSVDVFALLPDLANRLPVSRQSVSSDRTEDPVVSEPPAERESLTFQSLRDPLVHLILGAIVHEGSPLNKQLLLHALNALICDIGRRSVL